MPEVTVLTAVRNGARYLAATVDSILCQEFGDFEYIVVDDASDDATPDIIGGIAQSDSRVRSVRRERPGGPFVAANQGLALATGRYVVRTDADDLSLPGRIAAQLTYLREHAGRRACATYCRNIDNEGHLLPTFNTAPRTPGALKWYLCLRCPLVHSTACIETDALRAIGGYSELPLSQDARLWCELSRRGWVGVLPEVHVLFRRHDARLSALRTAAQKEYGKAIMGDHIEALTGSRPQIAALDSLYAVGHAEPHPLTAGLAALRAWDVWWQDDNALGPHEREELAALSAFRRRKFLRANLRTSPVQFLRNLIPFLYPRPRMRDATA